MSDPATPERVPSAAPAGPAPKKSSAVTCLIVGLCVGFGGILVLGVGAALLLPAIARATERAKVTSCASNLRQLWTLQQVYMSQFGGKEKSMPTETGAAFWLKLSRTTPPLIDGMEMEILLCPVHGQGEIGACDYLGPAKPVGNIGAAEPVGADRKGNHKQGGNVLRKSGDVLELPDADFLPVCDKLSP